MTISFTADNQKTDAELVTASRDGDREAFAQIVRRYQAMISGLVYCSCGDLHLSEDVAQDTFVTAWRSLATLREPQRLAAWLCQIARHRLIDDARTSAREKERLVQISENPNQSRPAQPEQTALAAEERELLWRTLSQIPSPYRETLVLYYRHNQSTAEVAGAMETSEETIRQRLVRGRQMLREQIAEVLEKNLAVSAPGSLFTAAVISALPAAVPHALTAATAGAATKASGAAKTAGLAGAIFAPIAATAGAIAADWARVRQARSARERQFLIKANWAFWIGLVVWFFVTNGVIAAAWRSGNVIELRFSGCAVWWLILFGPGMAFRIWVSLRCKKIQQEEGLGARLLDPAGRGFKPLIYGSMAGLVWGGGMWLWLVGQYVEDWVLVIAWPVLSLAAWLLAARLVVRHPEKTRGIFMTVLCGLAAAVVLVVNLRWDFWRRNVADHAFEIEARAGISLLLAVFYGSIAAGWWLKSQLLNTRHQKAVAAVAAGIYLAILLGMVVFRQLTKW